MASKAERIAALRRRQRIADKKQAELHIEIREFLQKQLKDSGERELFQLLNRNEHFNSLVNAIEEEVGG